MLAQVYRYDQLNRLKKARAVIGLDAGNTWIGVNDDAAAANRYRSNYEYDANGNILTAERWNADGSARYDSLHYHYHDVGVRRQRNRLYHLRDLAADGVVTAPDPEDLKKTTLAFDTDLHEINTPASTNNYRYDALGNLIYDEREQIDNIEWTVAGKVRSVTKTNGPSLAFAYGASGQRTLKQVSEPDLDDSGYREHYIRDAQGNIMATYRYKLLPVPNTTPQEYEASLKLNERPLYGSSRLGSLRKEVELHSEPFDPEDANPVQQVDLNYELTDHLGNVCAVVTGRLLDGNGGGTPKQAELLSAHGYEAFGQILSGRNYSSGLYRFGLNGQQKDDEIYGATGTSYTAEFWQYDPRTARRWNLDPKPQIYASDYSVFGLNPLYFIDPNGDEIRGSRAQKREFKRREKANGTWDNAKQLYQGKNSPRILRLHEIKDTRRINMFNLQSIQQAPIQTATLFGMDDDSYASRPVDHLYHTPLTTEISRVFTFSNETDANVFRDVPSVSRDHGPLRVDRSFSRSGNSIADYIQSNPNALAVQIELRSVQLNHDDINSANPAQYSFFLNGTPWSIPGVGGTVLTTSSEDRIFRITSGSAPLNRSDVISARETRLALNNVVDACSGFTMRLRVTLTKYRR